MPDDLPAPWESWSDSTSPLTRLYYTPMAPLQRPAEGAIIRFADTLLRVITSEPDRDGEGRETGGFTLMVEPLTGG